MAHGVAVVAVYSAMLLNGNPITDLLSIGGKTPLTGPPPPLPAHAGGNNVHQTAEGDASLSRADAYFGDGHSFNQTVFEGVRVSFRLILKRTNPFNSLLTTPSAWAVVITTLQLHKNTSGRESRTRFTPILNSTSLTAALAPSGELLPSPFSSL